MPRAIALRRTVIGTFDVGDRATKSKPPYGWNLFVLQRQSH
jgi:hypothetical protein